MGEYLILSGKQLKEQTDSGNGHGVLVTVLLGRAHVRELKTVSGKLAESADVCGRDEGSFDIVKAEQISYPFRIAFVGFLPLMAFTYLGCVRQTS